MKSSKRLPIADRTPPSGRTTVSLTAFSYLIAMAVRYSWDTGGDDTKLASIGRHVGIRLLELLNYRQQDFKRHLDLESFLLRFVRDTVWRQVFDKSVSITKQDDNSCKSF